MRQDVNTEISCKTHHSVNTDNACDTGDEDPRPAKRRKPRSAPAATAPLHLRSHPLVLPWTTSPEVSDTQPEADHGCSPTFIYNEHRHTSRTSRSPSAAAESVLAAEYEEWPLHGFLKRTRIGGTMMFNLEFHLTHVPEHVELSGLSQALHSNTRTSTQQTSHSAVSYSKERNGKLRHSTKRVLWTKEEDETLVKMKEDGCSWEEISESLPSRTPGAIQVRYSTKLRNSAPKSRKR
jgi:hypothetical protein